MRRVAVHQLCSAFSYTRVAREQHRRWAVLSSKQDFSAAVCEVDKGIKFKLKQKKKRFESGDFQPLQKNKNNKKNTKQIIGIFYQFKKSNKQLQLTEREEKHILESASARLSSSFGSFPLICFCRLPHPPEYIITIYIYRRKEIRRAGKANKKRQQRSDGI